MHHGCKVEAAGGVIRQIQLARDRGREIGNAPLVTGRVRIAQFRRRGERLDRPLHPGEQPVHAFLPFTTKPHCADGVGQIVGQFLESPEGSRVETVCPPRIRDKYPE